MTIEVRCRDPHLVKRLLSNPILTPFKPRWLKLRSIAEEWHLWLVVRGAEIETGDKLFGTVTGGKWVGHKNDKDGRGDPRPNKS